MNAADQLTLPLTQDRTGDWNPYYVAYARDHGMEPAAKLAEDCARGTGRMMPFMLWIQARWVEWGKLRGIRGSVFDDTSPDRHTCFAAWLAGGHPLYQDA
jgi:hypothetical protein